MLLVSLEMVVQVFHAPLATCAGVKTWHPRSTEVYAWKLLSHIDLWKHKGSTLGKLEAADESMKADLTSLRMFRFHRFH